MFLETRTLPNVVKRLLIINIGICVLIRLTGTYYQSLSLFSLIPSEVIQHFQVWRLFTYMFLHANIWPHLIFNMFFLWMFGPEVERKMGSNQFLFYYCFAGIGAALCSLVLSPGSVSPTVGASGSIFGVLVAFGMLFPDSIISMIFPPISMKAKHFVIVCAGLEFLLLLGGPSGINRLAHLGGMLFGYIYLRYTLPRYRLQSRSNPLSNKLNKWKNTYKEVQRLSKKQFMEEEVNPILDKISKVGMKGLTRRERQILKKAKDYQKK